MTTFNIIYFISILVTIAVMGFIALYSRRHRDIAASGTYMWIALLICLLAFFDGMVMISPTRDWALIWFNLRFLSFAIIPVLWLIFVLQYTGKSNLITKPRVAVLFIIPAITQIMIWTNSIHGLWVIQHVSFHEVGPFLIADTSTRISGPWNKINFFYSYTVMFAGILLLFVKSAYMFRQYRERSIAIGAGTLIMIVGSLFPAFNLIPGNSFNPLPQSFAMGSIIIAWGLYRYQFLGTTPLFKEQKQMPVVFFMLFMLLTVGIVSAGYFYYYQYKDNYHVAVENQLSSIAELKMEQLVQWRTERLGDAAVLDRNPVFTDLARRVFDNPADAEAQTLLQVWLGKIQSASQYESIHLLDIKGKPHIAVPGSTGPVSRYLLQRAEAINRAGKVTFLDFYRDAPDKPIHLSVVVPIIDKQKKRSIGLVVLCIDPETYLYPVLCRWQTPSKTAEALLVRREGNDVLFLNDLKFKKHTALNLRVPLTKVAMPSVMAVLGRQGIVEGIDYRGVPVVAAVRSVPNSPWYIIARMDAEEIYAPVRERLWLTTCLVFLLLAGGGATVLLLWLRQSNRFFLAQYKSVEMLRESERRLIEFQRMAQLGHWIWDINTGSVEWSEEVFRIFHLDPDAFTPRIDLIMALSPWPEDHERDRELIRQAMETHEKGTYEQRFLLPDKSIGYYYSTFQGNYDEGGNLVSIVGTVLDITERKRAEELLRQSEERYRSLFENSLLGISAAAPDGHLMYANQAYATMYGYDNTEQLIAEVKDVGGQLYANPDQRKEVLQILNEKGILEPREVDLVKRDGTLLQVLIAARAIRDSSGKLIYYQSTHLDITKRKWAEEEILRLNAELEQRVAARTTELLAKTTELERMNKVFIDQELRMRELKARIAELEKKT